VDEHTKKTVLSRKGGGNGASAEALVRMADASQVLNGALTKSSFSLNGALIEPYWSLDRGLIEP
jgi:hypothetical protein